MNSQYNRARPHHIGEHLKNAAIFGSFAALFFSLIGTLFIWAGSDSFNCPSIIWKSSLTLSILLFPIIWLIYLPFRNTDQLLGNGILSLAVLFSLFWMFGFSIFYFYFLFAPMHIWVRTIALVGVTSILTHRGFLIIADIKNAFQKNENLFDEMYYDEGTSITFTRDAVRLLERYRTNRNPFKSIHLYFSILLAPLCLVLNRLLTPIFGDGHGVFLVTSFLTLPLLMWGVEIIIQTIMTMIYYPIKLHRKTKKIVLLKDW